MASQQLVQKLQCGLIMGGLSFRVGSQVGLVGMHFVWCYRCVLFNHLVLFEFFQICFCQVRFWHMPGPFWWGRVKYTLTSHRAALGKWVPVQHSIRWNGLEKCECCIQGRHSSLPPIQSLHLQWATNWKQLVQIARSGSASLACIACNITPTRSTNCFM